MLRGGAGVYCSHDAQQPYDNLIDFGAGVRSYSRGDVQLHDPQASRGSAAATSCSAAPRIDINDDKQPKTYSWSLTLNQKLPWSMNIELGYVGNKQQEPDELRRRRTTTRCRSEAMVNDPTGNTNAYRPLPDYGDLQRASGTASYQNYHGLQALLARQRGNFNFTLAYTFSKALGIRVRRPEAPAVGSEYVLDPVPGLQLRRPATTTARTWPPRPTAGCSPARRRRRALKRLLGGWQLAGITSYVSGAPLPCSASGASNFNMQGTLADGHEHRTRGSPARRRSRPAGAHLRPDARTCRAGTCSTPPASRRPRPGANGSYTMPYMKAQAYWNVDLSLFKNFSLGGDKKLQLRRQRLQRAQPPDRVSRIPAPT